MRSRALVAVLALAVLALPVALAGTRYATYVEHVVVQMMVLGLYAMAWDFLNGYAGMFSFGHAAFFGAGAYAAGILIVQYKTAAFGISAFFAGLAGILNAFHERVVSPETLAWALSGDAVLYTTLGGSGTLLGPILGASLVILAREALSDYFRSWLIFVGLVYIALVVFLPSGLYPLFARRRSP